MWFNRTVTWSPCEVDYLKANKDERSINEMSLYLAKSRNAIKNKLDELDGKKKPDIKKNRISRIGKRDDIVIDGKPQFYRSSWEANYCRYLRSKGETWEYEPKGFFYDEVKHCTVSYCPDLKVGNTWVEVKGMMDGVSQTAIRRFKKYYPEEFKKLRAVVGRKGTKADKFFKKHGVPVIAYINELDKECHGKIKGWE